MSIKKVTLASLILLSLTACSSGGGSGSSSNNTEAKAKPPVHQPSSQNNSSEAKKAETDRVAKEKAEAERLKREEADRLAKEKAEAERLKKEEADRLAKEKAEAERLKKEEADRLAKEEAEAERLKKEEADRLAKEKAEAERLKKEEADRLAKEKADAERLKKEEADRLAKEKAEAERLKKEEFERSEREKYKNEKFKGSVFYNTFRKEDTLKVGFNPRAGEEQGVERSIVDDQNYKYHRYSPVYNQVYSIVIANYNKEERTDKTEAYFEDVRAYGYETPKDKLPKMGKATYSGIAFHQDQTGQLTYQVDFDKKIGSGDIKNLTAFGNIKLIEGKISQDIANSSFIQSSATSDKLPNASGKYKLAFFGENAEEIGGNLTFSRLNELPKDVLTPTVDVIGGHLPLCESRASCAEIGFGGTRGEIAK